MGELIRSRLAWVNELLDYLRRHPVVGVIMFIGVVVIALADFSEALLKLRKFVGRGPRPAATIQDYRQKVLDFSRLTGNRQVSAESLTLAIQQGASLTLAIQQGAQPVEVEPLKHAYDEALDKWTASWPGFLALVTTIVGQQGRASDFENLVEVELVRGVLQPLHRCVANAYKSRGPGGRADLIFKSCQVSDLLDQALVCNSAVTVALLELAGGSVSTSDRDALLVQAKSKCN